MARRRRRSEYRSKTESKKLPSAVTFSNFLATTPSKRSKRPERMITNPAWNQNSMRIRMEAIRVAKKPNKVKKLGLLRSPENILRTVYRKGSSRCPILLPIIFRGKELLWKIFEREHNISIEKVNAVSSEQNGYFRRFLCHLMWFLQQSLRT